MAFELKSIIPWGRNLSEYRNFFRLTDEDLDHPVLSCADGPASFNSELTALGGNWKGLTMSFKKAGIPCFVFLKIKLILK